MRVGGEPCARVPKRFFERGAAEVAPDLLGLYLVHATRDGLVAGRIVEVEAYLPEGDAASHAFAGRTARNAAMFGPGGHAYVYFVYGVHHCFNVVTGRSGSGQAVLVRALEPLEGIELMRARRGRHSPLCDGPGKLTVAFGIGPEHDGTDLARGPLGIFRPKSHAGRAPFRVGPRIGITKAAEMPLRFVSAPAASDPFPLAPGASSRGLAAARRVASPRARSPRRASASR